MYNTSQGLQNKDGCYKWVDPITSSKAHEIIAHACQISSQKTLSYTEVSIPIYGIIQLGLRSHPTGSSTLEAPTMTLSLFRTDKPVFTTAAFRISSPCHPTQAMAGPVVSHIRNPYPTFPGGVHHFHGCLDPGLGHPHVGFSNCGCMDLFRTRAPHQCFGAQGGNIGPHHWVTVFRAIMF